MTFEKLKEKWANEKNQRQNISAKRKKLLLDKGKTVFKKFGIRKVILFGSAAAGHSSDRSDIDILVMPLENNDYYNFLRVLEEILNITVDLYTDKDDPGFIQKIIERGEIIYEI